jgi:hypothetical protein
MTVSARSKLISKLRDLGMPPSSLEEPQGYPVVSLEDFFEGNADTGSIGCNLTSEQNPGIQSFYDTLRHIRAIPSVDDVLVEIHEVIEDDESTWPFSDRVYIITSMSESEVERLVADLHPDEVAEGWAYGVPQGGPALKPGMKVYGVWWD